MFDIEPTDFAVAIYPHFRWVYQLFPHFPMASDGQQEWIELYRNALVELDHTKLSAKIDAANLAIQQRINQLLMQKALPQEHLALEDALRNLRSLRRKIE